MRNQVEIDLGLWRLPYSTWRRSTHYSMYRRKCIRIIQMGHIELPIAQDQKKMGD
jgi:hypothetical protein